MVDSLSLAFFSNTTFVSGVCSPITTAVLGFIIPAFSAAICSRVLPKNAVWSNPILVIMDSTGFIMFVQSNRPPSPVSITAISTSLSEK